MKNRITLTLFMIVFFGLNGFSQPKDSLNHPDTLKHSALMNNGNNEVSINFRDIDRIEKLMEKPKDKDYSALIVSILAIVSSVIISVVSLNKSRKNLEFQLEFAKKQEIEKRSAETQLNQQNELKKLVVNFIQKATKFNDILNKLIYDDLENGRVDDANEGYDNTHFLRENLEDLYNSIRITLNDSPEQKELDSVLKNYMNKTIYYCKLEKLKSDEYEPPIELLFDVIKRIAKV